MEPALPRACGARFRITRSRASEAHQRAASYKAGGGTSHRGHPKLAAFAAESEPDALIILPAAEREHQANERTSDVRKKGKATQANGGQNTGELIRKRTKTTLLPDLKKKKKKKGRGGVRERDRAPNHC